MAPMTPKNDKELQIALQKDKILSLLDNSQFSMSAKIMLHTGIEKHTFEDYIGEMCQQDIISINHGGLYNDNNYGIRITDRGMDFKHKGGYKELWRDEMEEMHRTDELEAKREAALSAIEQEKLGLERKKVGISIIALLVSILGIGWSGYTSWRSSSNYSLIIDRVEILENKMVGSPDSSQFNSLIKQVSDLKNVILINSRTSNSQKFSTGKEAGQQ